MKAIEKKIGVPLSALETYDLFVNHFSHWWPGQYTWSQETLASITIDPVAGGLCSEIGPGGFRCDWGRVLQADPGKQLVIKWQIGPSREPIPDPDKASTVLLRFVAAAANFTELLLKHHGFEKHVQQAQEYRDGMDSPQGWEHILECFKSYIQTTGRDARY